MAELRWILLGFGVAFCLGLWWWETRRRRQNAAALRELDSEFTAEAKPYPPQARLEPTFDDPPEVRSELKPGRMTPAMAPTPELTLPAPKKNPIVSLRLLAPQGEPFAGGELLAALQDAGLEHGKFSIFHKHSAEGTAVFSVASLVEPGSFDLQTMPGEQFRGITFFALAQDAGEEGLADMRRAAQEVAGKLHGVLSGEG